MRMVAIFGVSAVLCLELLVLASRQQGMDPGRSSVPSGSLPVASHAERGSCIHHVGEFTLGAGSQWILEDGRSVGIDGISAELEHLVGVAREIGYAAKVRVRVAADRPAAPFVQFMRLAQQSGIEGVTLAVRESS